MCNVYVCTVRTYYVLYVPYRTLYTTISIIRKRFSLTASLPLLDFAIHEAFPYT